MYFEFCLRVVEIYSFRYRGVDIGIRRVWFWDVGSGTDICIGIELWVLGVCGFYKRAYFFFEVKFYFY